MALYFDKTRQAFRGPNPKVSSETDAAKVIQEASLPAVEEAVFLTRHQAASLLGIKQSLFRILVRFNILKSGRRMYLSDRRIYWKREDVLQLKVKLTSSRV